MPPVEIDGNPITGATIDGTDVTEITVDGQTVFSVGLPDTTTNIWLMDEGSGSTLADSEGSVSANFTGSWGTDGHFNNVTTYDGVDDIWRTNSTFGISNTNVSFAVWFNWQSTDEFACLVETTDISGNEPNNGWRVRETSGDFDLTVFSGGSGSTIHTTTTTPSQDGTWFFYAVAFDGNDADVYLYDRNTQLETGSGNGSRGIANNAITGMRLSDFPRFIEGEVAEAYASTTTTWSDNDIDTIWNFTR